MYLSYELRERRVIVGQESEGSLSRNEEVFGVCAYLKTTTSQEELLWIVESDWMVRPWMLTQSTVQNIEEDNRSYS